MPWEYVTEKAKSVWDVLSEKVMFKLRPEGWLILEGELWKGFLGRKQKVQTPKENVRGQLWELVETCKSGAQIEVAGVWRWSKARSQKGLQNQVY